MADTYLQLQVGDVIYYATIEKSKVTTKDEIKTAIVTDIQKSRKLYELEITLDNGMKFQANWNCDVTVENFENEESRKFKDWTYKPMFCHIFSVSEKIVKKCAEKLIEQKIERLTNVSLEIQNELVRLSGARIMYKAMRVKKPAEIVAETVIV